MKGAIVIVDHGSRLEQANAQLEAIAQRVRERFPQRLVVCAHLEIAEPTIAQAVDSCAAQAATEIVVHPFFLGPGRHTQSDIPEQVAAAAAAHPEIRIAISEPLGLHEAVIDAIADRIEEAG